MAMTIDDDIEMLELIHEDYRGCRIAVALENTIDNSRKYQKIQEIVKSWEGNTWTDGISEDCMEKISEVMKDGNYD